MQLPGLDAAAILKSRLSYKRWFSTGYLLKGPGLPSTNLCALIQQFTITLSCNLLCS
jgi:hypothetical protein